MIYIQNLLDAEKKLSPHKTALTHVLGDSFLLKKNEIYRQRRELAQKLNIKFKKAKPIYTISPLLCLPEILKSKSVPYIENLVVLKDLSKNKVKITLDELLFLGTQKNHILHETSHIIMWTLIQKNLVLNNKTELMTAYLLSESYANYSETIANIKIDSRLHQSFLKLNSFWDYAQEESQDLELLQKKHGSFVVNAALFACFIYTNFLYKKISNYECHLIKSFISTEPLKISISEIKILFKISNQLNIHFLMQTADLFWKSIGIKGASLKNLDFDPIHFILMKPELRTSLINLLSFD